MGFWIIYVYSFPKQIEMPFEFVSAVKCQNSSAVNYLDFLGFAYDQEQNWIAQLKQYCKHHFTLRESGDFAILAN